MRFFLKFSFPYAILNRSIVSAAYLRFIAAGKNPKSGGTLVGTRLCLQSLVCYTLVPADAEKGLREAPASTCSAAEECADGHGLHESLVSEEVWQAAQVKMKANAQKYELAARPKTDRVHLLSNILKCPVCGAEMYGNKSIKKRPDGTKYKDFYYYGCKHRNMQRGYKCDYRKQIQEEVLDAAVAEVVSKLVSNPRFAAMMQEKINMKVDTTAIEQEIAAYEKQLRQHYFTKSRLMEEIDSLDPDDRHFIARKSDLDDRLYKMYDKIEEVENGLMDARAKKQAIEADKITGDNIYKILICFDKLYATMTEAERRRLVEILIDEVQIYPERQPNGQWLKSVRFKLPIIDHDLELSLDNQDRVEVVCSMVRFKKH